MLPAYQKFPFNDVVIVADILSENAEIPIEQRRDLEQSDNKTLKELADTINLLGKTAHHYKNPKELAENAKNHLNDIVLTIFGGTVSRNRMALVPAICEAFGLSFVGPDTYGRIICQDKEVSKAIAAQAGLKVSPHRIIRNNDELTMVLDFPIPYVAKPLWEGSSIGISASNLVKDRNKGKDLVEQLLLQFQQPVMIESFIPGREVSWCFIDTAEGNPLSAFAEIIWNNEPDHFDKNLYDAPHKLIAEGRKVVRNIDNELSLNDVESMKNLIQMISHIGYGRIDGKFNNGEFVFLEVTPDAWIGSTGTFASSFINNGLSFVEVIANVLLSAQTDPHNQLTND